MSFLKISNLVIIKILNPGQPHTPLAKMLFAIFWILDFRVFKDTGRQVNCILHLPQHVAFVLFTQSIDLTGNPITLSDI